MAEDLRSELHAIVDHLDDQRLHDAYNVLSRLMPEQRDVVPGEGIYHTLPLTDPVDTSVIARVRLGPFHNEAEAKRVADAIVSEIAALYLTSGADWRDCVHHVMFELYGDVVADS